MKQLLLALCTVIFLSSCAGGPSACDCAKTDFEKAKKEIQIEYDFDLSEDEKEELENELEKLEKKEDTCDQKSEDDDEFRRERDKCFTKNLWE